VAVGSEAPGDAVHALDGRPSTVVSATPDPGQRTVQKPTVEFAPMYLVDAEVREGWGGIWVHHSCNPPRGGVYTLDNYAEQPSACCHALWRVERSASQTSRPSTRALGLEVDGVYCMDDYPTRRGLEQLMSDQYQPILNRIHPVSQTRNRAKREAWMQAAYDFLNGNQ
jgi:hypothetical protein